MEKIWVMTGMIYQVHPLCNVYIFDIHKQYSILRQDVGVVLQCSRLVPPGLQSFSL